MPRATDRRMWRWLQVDVPMVDEGRLLRATLGGSGLSRAEARAGVQRVLDAGRTLARIAEAWRREQTGDWMSHNLSTWTIYSYPAGDGAHEAAVAWLRVLSRTGAGAVTTSTSPLTAWTGSWPAGILEMVGSSRLR